MSGDESSVHDEALIYMVTGIDESCDIHIFVTSDQQRAERRRADVLDQFTEVKANWLDPS